MTLDARGFSCPEPMVMIKKALKTEKELTMLLDTKGAAQNCESYAAREGFNTVLTSKDGEWTLVAVAK